MRGTKMSRTRVFLQLAATLLMAGCTQSSTTTMVQEEKAPTSESPWKLIWADEFDGPGIDASHWTHQVFAGIHSGNNELQHYTDRPANSYVEDGKLVIKAVREDYEGHAYTSARLTTAKKFSFRYGKVEARIKLPSTPGIWPAFWMMPEDSVYGGWPHSGEIDIVESVNDADEVYGTIHYGQPHHVHQGNPFKLPEKDGVHPLFSEDFHVYTVEWQPGEIRWYADGQRFSTQTEWSAEKAPYPAPFDQEFHLILNVAVGGYWPGPPDATSQFPQKMEVDWVRVYQTDNEFPTLKIVSPSDGERVPGGEPVRFIIEADDADGEIARVVLTDGARIIATDDTPPYELVYPDLADGCYERLAVLAYDNTEASARETRMLIVGEGCPQKPYGSAPASIPGKIEAEHFDEGWRDEAYHDTDKANNGNQFRPDSGVDIGVHEGAFYVGWTEPGEWVEYEVEVKETGHYSLQARVSAGTTGGTFTVADTGAPGAFAVIVEPTGDWNNFVTVKSADRLPLEQGRRVLRVLYPDGAINLDWMILEKSE